MKEPLPRFHADAIDEAERLGVPLGYWTDRHGYVICRTRAEYDHHQTQEGTK